MKNMIFVLFIVTSLTSCTITTYTNGNTGFGTNTNFSNQQSFDNYCNGTPVPVCDNSGIPIQKLYGSCEIISINGINNSQVNSISRGAYIDGVWRNDCVFTINVVVNHPNRAHLSMSRSIPISQEQMQALQNGQTIQVSFVW